MNNTLSDFYNIFQKIMHFLAYFENLLERLQICCCTAKANKKRKSKSKAAA